MGEPDPVCKTISVFLGVPAMEGVARGASDGLHGLHGVSSVPLDIFLLTPLSLSDRHWLGQVKAKLTNFNL